VNRKAIFDVLRSELGRPLTGEDVAALDVVLDKMEIAMNLGGKGEALIKKWEGYAKDLGNGKVQSYPDPATGGAPWTIGWGSTGKDIIRGTVWTKAQAQERFASHVAQFSDGVSKALAGAKTTQDQFDAMVSLAYNVGIGNFNSSTLLRKHKAGDYTGAKLEFARWNKAAGRVMAGLKSRRADEAKLYGGLG